MVFARHLRDRIRSGRIRCTIRIWTRPHVRIGGRYRMEDGSVVVDAITLLQQADLTEDLARESGFESVAALLGVARHGRGNRTYLIRFRYVPPGGWDTRV